METLVIADQNSGTPTVARVPTENSSANERCKRRRFTIREKLAMVRFIKRRVAEGESIRSACRKLNIQLPTL